jgi:O-antigen ligase
MMKSTVFSGASLLFVVLGLIQALAGQIQSPGQHISSKSSQHVSELLRGRSAPFSNSAFVNQAHNDYLQLLVETGLAGFAIAVWFLVLVFRQAAGKLKNWTENASGALTVAALLGCVGILVHSFLDFNLQIPSNAALFYVLSAIAASAPLQESQRRRVLRRHSLIVQPSPETTASRSQIDLG